MSRQRLLIVVGPQGLAGRFLGDRTGRWVGSSRLTPDATLAWFPDALVALKEGLEVPGRSVVDIVLLRPLVLGKILELPRLRPRPLRELVTLGTERFFPVPADGWAADAQPMENGKDSPTPTLLAAVSDQSIEAVSASVEAAELRLARIVPLPHAAVEYVRRLARQGAIEPSCCVELSLPGCSEIVCLEGGVPVSTFPCPPVCHVNVSESFVSPADCCPATRDWELALDLADAAARARSIVQPLTVERREARTWSARRRTRLIGVAASVVLLASFGLQIVGQERELASLRAVRRVIEPDVQQAIKQREALHGLELDIDRLTSAQASLETWPLLLRDLARSLPESAYVTEIAGRPDSLILHIAVDDGLAISPRATLGPKFELSAQGGQNETGIRVVAAWRSDVSPSPEASYAD